MIGDVLKKFPGKKLLVLGDVMLDHYVWGRVERISQEAPVPVLEAQQEEWRLGGAANVALNIRTLGAEVTLCGLIGSDSQGGELTKLLAARGISPDGLITAPERPTTVKTRIGSASQQIVRLDVESKADIAGELEQQIIRLLAERLTHCDLLLIEDYNKGLLTDAVIASALALAKENGIPVAVDPKQKRFFSYRGVDIFKPNLAEMQSNLGVVFESETDFLNAARKLRADQEIANLVVTRGSLGLYVFGGEAEPVHLPTYAKEVYDVSGAGDTAIAALALAYACGSGIRLAAEIANHAAGVVCGIKGTASVTTSDILQSYAGHR